MAETISSTLSLTINGQRITVPVGTSVAAALLGAGTTSFRQSVTGQARGPLCGMGICFECRVRIDGRPHQRSCQITCRSGMEVWTDG